jgi:hypothetical protein
MVKRYTADSDATVAGLAHRSLPHFTGAEIRRSRRRRPLLERPDLAFGHLRVVGAHRLLTALDGGRVAPLCAVLDGGGEAIAQQVAQDHQVAAERLFSGERQPGGVVGRQDGIRGLIRHMPRRGATTRTHRCSGVEMDQRMSLPRKGISEGQELGSGEERMRGGQIKEREPSGGGFLIAGRSMCGIRQGISIEHGL